MVISPKKNLTTVLFHNDEYAYIKEQAAERRVSMGQVVREAVRALMGEDSANRPMVVPPSEEAAD